eukprot:scaffold58946_cov63-Phaeocystis_antarctica.AAC.8
MWTRLGRTTGDSRASRHAATPPPSVPEAVAAPPRRVPTCVRVCVPLVVAGAAVHPPDRQQLLLGGPLRGAHPLGGPRLPRAHHLQGHVGPAHGCAARPPLGGSSPRRSAPCPSPPNHPNHPNHLNPRRRCFDVQCDQRRRLRQMQKGRAQEAVSAGRERHA